MNADPIERQARDLAKEMSNLPARWQLWLFEQLQKDLGATDAGEHRAEQQSEEMVRASGVLRQAANHLGLSGEAAQLALTMREFDQAPASARDGQNARQVKLPFGDSWSLAKAFAFRDQKPPVSADRRRKRQNELPLQARSTARHMDALREWLATEPAKRKRSTYEAWRREHNQQLSEGAKPAPAVKTLLGAWRQPWAEIVEASENNRFPGANAGSKNQSRDFADASALTALREQAVAAPADLIDDSDLRARRIAQLQLAAGMNGSQFARQAGISVRVLRHIETGRVTDQRISTLLKIVKGLGVSLDLLATDDGKTGLPILPKSGERLKPRASRKN